MNIKLIGFLFFGLAALTLLGRVAALGLWSGFDLLPSGIFQGFSMAIANVAIGLTYILLHQRTHQGSIAIVGIFHFVLSLAATLASIYGTMIMFDGSPAAEIGMVLGGSGMAFMLGNLVFIVALIIGVNSRPKIPANDIFG